MTNRISLLSVFLLLLTAVIGCNKLADFVAQSLSEYADQQRLNYDFGELSIKRFEQMFRTKKYDFDYKGDKGGNILHYAVLTENFDRVKLLVEHGADVNATDNDGQTSLHQAVERFFYSDDKSDNNMNIVKYLVEHGADVNAKDNLELTVLHRASTWGNLELVKYLVEHGADINEKNWRQETPLIQVAQSNSANHLELVQVLVEHGADINKAPFGGTVLHYAAKSGDLELVEWLVEQGLDVNAKDDSGETALHFAVKSRNLELVEWLVEQGLDVNAKDDSGKTVLQYAKKYWDREIIEYLKEHGSKESEQ